MQHQKADEGHTFLLSWFPGFYYFTTKPQKRVCVFVGVTQQLEGHQRGPDLEQLLHENLASGLGPDAGGQALHRGGH